jgi:hypothetical protein
MDVHLLPNVLRRQALAAPADQCQLIATASDVVSVAGLPTVFAVGLLRSAIWGR